MRRIALIVGCLIAARAAYGLALMDISGAWRLHVDPQGEGGQSGWAQPDFDDSVWELVNLAEPQIQNRAAGHQDAIWCRRWVELPETWPRTYLALSGMSGRADLYVNGELVAQGLNRFHQGTLQIIREITAATGPSRRFHVAIKITVDRDGKPPGFDCRGGMPVMLARDARGLFVDRRGWFDYLAQEHPDLTWPSWARGEGTNWYPITEPYGMCGAVMGAAGQLEPEGGDFTVSIWLYYRAARRFYSLESAAGQVTLEGKYLPLPLFKAKIGKWFQVYVRSWLHSSPESAGLKLGIGEITVENTLDRPREIDLIIAIHPFGVKFPPHEIESIAYDSMTRSITVNGRPALVLTGEPDLFGGTSFSDAGGTVARLLARDELPAAREVHDPKERLASAAAVYRLQIQPYGARTQTFRYLLQGQGEEFTPELANRMRDVKWKASWLEAVGVWRKTLTGPGKTIIRLPDSAAQNAFYASVAYIRVELAKMQMLKDQKILAAAALMRAGHEDALRGYGIDPRMAWSRTLGGAISPPMGEFAHARGAGPAWAAGGFHWPGQALEEGWRMLGEGRNEEAAEILGWWLDRQTFPGTYLWAEAVDPATNRYGGGSVPDLRAAASCVCLLRDMMLREADGSLLLASGVPYEWIKPGRRLQIRNAPTEFGVIPGFSILASPRELTMRMYTFEQLARLERKPILPGLVPARPPAGYRWRIPGTRHIERVTIDGRVLPDIPEDRTLELPDGFRTVRVIW